MTAPVSPFPPLANRPLGSSRPRPARIAIVVVVALVLLGGAAVAVAATTSSGPSGYRTAKVTDQTVQQTLPGTGTIDPISEATVAFPTSGTVSRVDVAVGQGVDVGTPLAELDTGSMQSTLTDAKATLASAELTLYQALNGEQVTGGSGGSGGGSGFSGGSGSGSGSTGAATTPASLSLDRAATIEPVAYRAPAAAADDPAFGGTTTTGSGGGSGLDAKIKAAQQAVLDAQKKVDADLAAAQKALDAANAACAPSTPPTSTSTTTPASTTPVTPDPSACQAALQEDLVDQQAVASDQDALATASTNLTQLLALQAAQSASSHTGTGTGSGSGAGRGTTGTGSSSSTGRGSSTSRSATGTSSTSRSSASSSTSSSPSAAQLVAYQAAVDAASSKVDVATQALTQAEIISPILGHVVAVDLKVGDKVSAGSSTADIVVQGPSGYEVSTTVTVDELDSLKIGQAAQVLPDGSTVSLPGKVVSIGVTPSSSSSTTYPVVIGFTEQVQGLRNGSTAAVSIQLDRSSRGLAVPTSAVTATNGQHFVSVLVKGQPTSTAVTLGAVGTDYTAITSGLKLGQVVVLADFAQPLPASASQTGTNTSARGGAGGFGGGGFGGPGGFGGFGGGGGGFGGGGRRTAGGN